MLLLLAVCSSVGKQEVVFYVALFAQDRTTIHKVFETTRNPPPVQRQKIRQFQRVFATVQPWYTVPLKRYVLQKCYLQCLTQFEEKRVNSTLAADCIAKDFVTFHIDDWRNPKRSGETFPFVSVRHAIETLNGKGGGGF
ncbi:hypothetical protein NPIL_470141 [Nephila pilipes]|uniref:Uncharacterized protein n=1 Tax=Nephila pilipes TaxID=299642 RepID=A0A8X6TGK1_NEPPI|nr:hypothetical protein NPIL_470141 [Nephila pilipes]